MEYGFWSLLPALLVVIVAIKTKRPLEALILGCVSSYAIIAIINKQNFITIFFDAFFKVATNRKNVWLIMICGLFGSLILLLNVSRGTHAIARTIGRFCKTEKKLLFSAWILGIIIFIDDYMNILTTSSCLKEQSDKLRIPRPTLAYVINSTGAPICVIVPFSTWAIFYATTFFEQPAVQALGYASAMDAYMAAIPFMFYAFAAVLIVPLFIWGIIPVFGPLKKYYTDLAVTVPIEGTNKTLKNEIKEERAQTGKAIDFIIPIGVMIIVTIIQGDMLIALVASILTCGILYVPRKIIKLGEFADLWVKGFADLIPTLAVLLFAFFMKQACTDINLPQYVIHLAEPLLNKYWFPAMAFVLVSILAFITGDSWGVPSICIPIIIPMAAVCDANIILTMAAVVSGGVFCSHACFYSDATILTATCCEIRGIDHSKTQFPYAMIGYIISFILFVICGFVM